ncbi:MAG: hypothetical protein KDA21_03590 [Phycisphaerales bacterium]|nr:hypothetical protein [Phycisphaerales bacterium]
MKTRTTFVRTFLMSLAMTAGTTLAEPMMSLQARPTDPSGQILPDGELPLTIRVFSSATGGSPVETMSVIATVASGVLSATVPLDHYTFNGDPRWIEFVYDGETLEPRLAVNHVPYAFAVEGISMNGWKEVGLGTAFTNGTRLHIRNGSSATPLDPTLIVEGGLGNPFYSQNVVQLYARGREAPARNILLFDHGDDPHTCARMFSETVGSHHQNGAMLKLETSYDSLEDFNSDQLVLSNTGMIGMGTALPADSLHIYGTAAGLRLDDDTDPNSFTRLADAQPNQFVIHKLTGSGASLIDIEPRPTDGTGEAYLRFFRGTNTAGPKSVLFMRGNNTTGVSARIAVDGGNSYFQAHGGTLSIGTSAADTNYRLNVSGGASVTPNAAGMAITTTGRIRTGILEITGGADLVEPFESDSELEPGTVVVIDADNPGQLTASRDAYDSRVAGIVSGAGGVSPGIRMGQNGVTEGEALVAMTGRVYVKCSTESGPVRPGDLLTTSSLAGHAMKATDHSRAFGAVIGKAMSSLEDGEGIVLVLVNLQ